MIKLAVSACTDFITHRWLEINIDSTGHLIMTDRRTIQSELLCNVDDGDRIYMIQHSSYMLAAAGLAKKGVERVISFANARVRRHGSVRFDAMLKTVQLPALVANLK